MDTQPGLGIAGHLVVLAIAITATLVTAPTDELRWEPFVYALLPIAIFVSLGTLMSALVPNIVGSALSIALAYLVAFNVASGALKAPLLVGGHEATLVGTMYSGGALAVWSLTAVGMVLVLVIGTVGAVSARRAAPAITVTVCAVAIACVAPAILPIDLAYRLAPSQRVIEYRCAGETPTVCVAAGHTWHLTELAKSVATTGRALQSAGVDLSGVTFRERSTSSLTADGPYLNLDVNSVNADRFSPADLAAVFSRPTECPAYDGRDPKVSDSLSAVSDALTEWIVEHVHPSADPGAAATLPASWARSAYAALLDCSVPASVRGAIGPSN